MRRLLLTLSAVTLTATAVADTYPRQASIDALHYAFKVSLRDESDEIEAEAAVTLAFVKDDQRFFALDLATVSDGRGMTISSVTSNGADVPFTHKANRLEAMLADPPKAGEHRTLLVKYKGTPGAGLRIGPNRYGERTYFTDHWPDKAHHWLPMIDHPYDKATSEFVVTAPSKYQVVSNGLLIEETDLGDGQRLTHWKQSVPIASWLNAVGVGRFTSHHAGSVRGVPVETWVHPRDRKIGLDALESPALRVLDFYAERIGPFPYEKLAGIQAPGTHGGMEHASAIFFGETSVNRGPATKLVAHEVAHQWFGDSVTERDWDDIWLSEGFATYFTLLFTEHEEGRDAFLTDLRKCRDRVLRAESRNSRLAVLHSGLADTKKILNDLVYQKGAWVLHMLRGQLGDDTFTAGIRRYYATYRDGNVSTSDFRRILEEVSGTELSWFFEQWLSRPGHPVVEWDWRYDAAAKAVVVELTQTQPGELYRLPLNVQLSFNEPSTSRREKVEMTERQQRSQIRADREPSKVELDPGTWLLMESRINKR